MFRRRFLRGMQKRRAAAFTAAVLCTVSAFSLHASAESVLEDLNGDGVINVYDYVLAKRGTVEAVAPASLSISSAEAIPGETVTVSVSLSDSTDCTFAELALKYAPELILADEENAAKLNEETLSALSPIVNVYPTTNKVVYYTSSFDTSNDNGELFSFQVKVPDDAAPGTVYSINFNRVSLLNNDGNMPILTSRGKITVKQVQTPVVKTGDRAVMFNGTDISQWQGNINWEQFYNENNYDYVMIRAGYGRYASQVDPKFRRNYEGAKAVGMPCGVYWYSYAMTPEDAVREAQACAEVIKGCTFEFPIAYDFEESKQLALPPEKSAAIIDAFAKEMESRGYYVMLYCSSFFLTHSISKEIRERYDVWVAHYNVKKPSYQGNYGMWQYGLAENLKGVTGPVDVDYCYKNYPAIMRRASLNGY